MRCDEGVVVRSRGFAVCTIIQSLVLFVPAASNIPFSFLPSSIFWLCHHHHHHRHHWTEFVVGREAKVLMMNCSLMLPNSSRLSFLIRCNCNHVETSFSSSCSVQWKAKRVDGEGWMSGMEMGDVNYATLMRLNAILFAWTNGKRKKERKRKKKENRKGKT